MKSDAEYAAGWNSSAANVTPSQSYLLSDPVEQEYQGVFFCMNAVAHLTVRVHVRAEGMLRHAVLGFGPHTTSLQLPKGAFETSGTIGPGSGILALSPDRWLSQPPGYLWFGSEGRSDDVGRSYSGRVTGKSPCTRFTLALTSAATIAR